MNIVTAFAEPACGPGWANSPLWVIVKRDDGKMYVECIQPEDQTNQMRLLYPISSYVHNIMSKEASKVLIG